MPTALSLLSSQLAIYSIGPTGYLEIREKDGGLYSYSVPLGQVDDVTDAIWAMGGVNSFSTSGW